MVKKSPSIIKILFVSFCLLLLGISPTVYGQENEEPLSDFQFTVEGWEDGIELSCQKGCAWKTLTFKVEGAQAVNQYGMTGLNEEQPKGDSDLANFLFTIEPTSEGVELRGIEGTAWTHLTFGMKGKQSQSVDEMGMTSSE